MNTKLVEKNLGKITSKDFPDISVKNEDWKYIGKNVYSVKRPASDRSMAKVLVRGFDYDAVEDDLAAHCSGQARHLPVQCGQSPS